MSRAVFDAAADKELKPADYYRGKKDNTVWWKVSGTWYRMFTDGSCGHCTKDVADAFGTPDSRPIDYEPRYGAFTITINSDTTDDKGDENE